MKRARSRSFAWLLVAAIAAGFGCGGGTKACKQGTLFVTITFAGPTKAADEISVDVSVAGATPTMNRRPLGDAGTSGETIEIDFPNGNGYPTGSRVDVQVTAYQGGAPIATGSGSVPMLPEGCAALTIAVGGTGTGTGGMGGTAGPGGTAGGGTTGTGGAVGRGGTTGTAGTGGTVGAAGTGGAAGAAGTGGGAAGRGGTTGTAGTMGTVVQSVLERNKNPSRDGHFIQSGLTTTAVATMVQTPGFNAMFSGVMYASPLYLENGPIGKGELFAVTNSNNVVALDEMTGATLWMKSIGSSPTDSGAGCGSIHPIGILSTPVIDATARTIYVAGAIGTSTIARHEVHALSVDDGSEKSGWPVDVSTVPASGGTTFMPQPANQRSALSLVGGVLYVAYGGHVGDCGPYHGWVVGINAASPATKGGWATGGQGEGIWAAAGMASDGNGVFAATGNRTSGTGTHQDSEEVVRVTGLGTRADTFWPTTPMSGGATQRWQAMDSGDYDLGSVNPVYVQLPGSTPQNMVIALSKDGHLYILDAANLGGADGRKVDFTVAGSGMSVHTPPTVYRTAMGLYYVFATTANAAMCPGGLTGKAIVAVRIAPGNPPTPTIAWCAQLAGMATGAPISTTTNGTDNAVVWFINGGPLRALDGDTGAVIWTSSNTCSGVYKWSSPIAFKNRIVASGSSTLCSWSVP